MIRIIGRVLFVPFTGFVSLNVIDSMHGIIEGVKLGGEILIIALTALHVSLRIIKSLKANRKLDLEQKIQKIEEVIKNEVLQDKEVSNE